MLDLTTIIMIEKDRIDGKFKIIKNAFEDYDDVFYYYYGNNQDAYLHRDPQRPIFKNKELVEEYFKEFKVLGIYLGWLQKSILFDMYHKSVKDLKDINEFEKMVEDWDTRRKLKEIVKSGGKKFKNKKKKVI